MTASTTRVRLRRYATRTAIALTLAAVLLIGAAFAGAAVLHIPAPPTLVRLLLAPPSEQGALFPSRTIAASPTPHPFPVAGLPDTTRWRDSYTVPWHDTRITMAQFLDRTHTNSFLVLRNGLLTNEWYRDGVAATTRQSSWSVAKSVVSLLVGRAIGAGKLREDTRLVQVLPELTTGTDYDTITVRELLDMTSGVDVAENYNRAIPLMGTARMYLTTDLDGFVRAHRDLRFAPGSRADYRSVDTQLLGAMVARVEGRPLGQILAQDIWAPIGAQDEAQWNLDHDGGQEKGFCCLNATARDFAKIGQLVLDGGRAQGMQLVPAAWIDRIRTPAPLLVADWGYSALWWHPAGATEDLTAIGVYGQYIYIDPPTGTVIVKLSDHGTSQDRQETVEVFRALAHGV